MNSYIRNISLTWGYKNLPQYDVQEDYLFCLSHSDL